MMLRNLLLLLLPLLAVSGLTEQERKEAIDSAVKSYEPCILHDKDCDQLGGFNYQILLTTVNYFRQYAPSQLPEKECSCDAKSEQCNRACYLGYIRKMISESVNKRSVRALSEQDRQEAIDRMLKTYEPCVLHGKDCDQLGGLTYEQMLSTVTYFRKNVPGYLPEKDCSCDATSEQCNRGCYLGYIRKLIADSVSKRSVRAPIKRDRQETIDNAVKSYEPCVLHNKDCDQLGGLNYERIQGTVDYFRKNVPGYLPEKDCSCDATSEQCNRGCYLGYIRKLISESVNKRSTRELSGQDRNEAIDRMLKTYEPCVLRGKDCDQLGGLTYEQIVSNLDYYRKNAASQLPAKDCSCDATSEQCNRACYLGCIRKMIADSMRSRQEIIDDAVKTYEPCVLHNKDCDQMGGLTYEQIASSLSSLRQYSPQVLPPKECSCDATSEQCNRGCYLGYIRKLISDSASKRSVRELSDAQKAMAEYVDRTYTACILYDTCPDGVSVIPYEVLVRYADSYRRLFKDNVLEQCKCDPAVPLCNRGCYLAYLKKAYVESV